MRRNWTTEQAVDLVPPPKGHRIPQQVFCQGRSFRSEAAFIEYYGKSENTVRRRLAQGHSPEIAVDLSPLPGVITCYGEKFRSIKELSRRFKKTPLYIRRRRKTGLTWEEAVR